MQNSFTCYGYIIKYDTDSNDACRWVVLDGNKKIRCLTRTAAMRICCQMAAWTMHYNEKTTVALMLATDYADKAWRQLEPIVNDASGEDSEELALISLQLRKLTDKLNKYIETNERKNKHELQVSRI